MDSVIEVIARGVLLRGPIILLCQNVKHGYWYLPGGHVEFGELAAAALAREFSEECGLEVRVGNCELVTEGVFEARRTHHEINLVFRVAEVGDAESEIVSKEPGVSFGWFDLAQLQEVDLRPAGIKAWLLAGGRSDGPCAWISEVPGGLTSVPLKSRR